ncbi:MAG: putative nucleic-acid-binding protein [Gammaproteobacteria bacterium]
MKALDTNVLVRYLVQDDPGQSLIATRFIEKNCTTETPAFIGHIVLCELVWILESNYSLDREAISTLLERLMQVAQLIVMEPSCVWKALNDYKRSNVDFADHLLARVNEAQGCEVTVTFDKKAGMQPMFELLE